MICLMKSAVRKVKGTTKKEGGKGDMRTPTAVTVTLDARHFHFLFLSL